MNSRLYHLTTRRTAARTLVARTLLWGLLLLACALGAALAPTPAHAQSADLPFAPDVNGPVYAIAVQADGKILIGGSFTQVNGVSRSRLARLLPNGTLDSSFSVVPNSTVYAIHVTPTGDIVFGGSFTAVNSQTRTRIATAASNGALYGAFMTAPAGIVNDIKAFPDGDLLVAFSVGVMRYNADGSLDDSFSVTIAGSWYPYVDEVELLPNGKVLVAGRFDTINGQSGRNFVRLNGDGSLDLVFPIGSYVYVRDILVQGEKYIAIGTYSSLYFSSYLIRFSEDGERDSTFASTSGSGGVAHSGAILSSGVIAFGGDFVSVDNNFSAVMPNGETARWSISINSRVNVVYALPDGSVLIGGEFTTINGQTRNRLARITSAGALDHPLSTSTNDNVYAVAQQPNGTLSIGGAFLHVDGQPHVALARITPTATVDSAFTPSVTGAVFSLIATPDNHLLVGGAFSAVNGTPRTNLARLLPDATLDDAFIPNPNGPVYGLLRQADSSVVVAGDYTQIVGDANAPRLTRVDAAGALDLAFSPNPSAAVRALAQQQDSKLVIGGGFTSVGGQPAERLARVTGAGAFDASFVASATGGDVYAVLVQPDGKIVVGGAFTQINGQARPYLARLEANGALDASFAPTTTVGGAVYALALQPDGRLIVGGAFTSVSVDGTPVTRNRLARFDAGGELDAGWDPNANDTVYALALQPDGKVLVGGAFTTMGGQPHGHIARLSSDLAAFQTLTVASDGDSVLWTQAGAGPELTAVRFYSSTDAVNYVPMGEGVRLDAGWTITDVTLPMSQTVWVKAYGEYPGGQFNGSTSAYDAVRTAFVRAADVVMTTQVVGGVAQPSEWRFIAASKQVENAGVLRVDPGSYSVSYTGPDNYSLTGASGACGLADDIITLNAVLGANTCTLTFTRDAGTITFAKTVEGGAAQASAFSFTVGAQTASHSQALVIETGVYTVTESGPAGYQVRTASGACALVNGALRLTVTKAGGTCSVTNAWPITLAKQVSGGTAVAGDWTFTVAGQTLAPGSQVVLAPGKYAVTESGPVDYTLYSASGDCAIEQGVVQLSVPGNGLCTITNRRDTGTITFVKAVEGGAAQPGNFSFTVLTQTVPHGQALALDTGVYTITESGPAGYVLRTASGTCALVDGAIRLTVSKTGGTCTVNNTWPVAFAKLVEGGDALPMAWSFGVNGQTISPTATMLLAPGSYAVTESGPPRYSLAAASGDCALVEGAAVLTVPATGNSTGQCTLTNRRDTGAITFRTTVEGEGAVAANFTYTVLDQAANGDAGQLTLPTEAYIVAIEGPDGFIPRVAGGACTLVEDEVHLTVEKAGGECAITMTHPVKFVSVVEGGTRNPASWGLRVGDILFYHNSVRLLAPGVYTPTVPGSISTYRLVAARDACALDAQGQTLTLTAPGNGLCTVVHRRVTGNITFTRVVQGGDAQPADWVTLVNGQPMPLNEPIALATASYVVTESGPPDYVVTAASGICALDRGQIKLTVTEEGGECGLVSTRGIGPVGFVMYPGGGNAQASEWSFVVNGQVVQHNGALLMPVGLYTVTVQGPAGYSVIGASGICSLTEGGDVQMNVGVEGGACNLQSAYDAGGSGAIGFYAAPSDDVPPELWNFVANGQAVDHNQTLLMPVGAYTVTVNGPEGYHVAGATGVCALVANAVQLNVTVFGGACTVQTAPDAAPPPQAEYAIFLPAVTR